MGRAGVAFGCLRFPHLFDLHLDRRRRIGNRQYDADDGRTHDQIGQHEKLARNWVLVSIGNLAGALFMAYFLGHYVGLAEGAAAAKTMAIAESKVNMDFGRAFVSAIACNWMVCMGIWFYFGAKHTSGRILAMWFPVMIFVLIGVQHFVANMFIIPAGIFAGADITWGQFFSNMVPVFLGNVVGGSSFVAASYLYAFKHLIKDDYMI